jgi:hypothetical protein
VQIVGALEKFTGAMRAIGDIAAWSPEIREKNSFLFEKKGFLLK